MVKMAQHGLTSQTSRSVASYSGFNLPSSSSSSAGDDDAADDNEPLPFPAALARNDFLAPDFDPAAYLSALHTGPTARHQTLEDLRAELRDRSTAISSELLELVNANYTSFLGLGDELKGGEERVEDIRVALLGFKRIVEEVQGRVRERRVEVSTLNRELQGVRSAIETGRQMLELEERVTGLEARLTVGNLGRTKKGGDEEDWWDDNENMEESDEEDEEEDNIPGLLGSSPSKIMSLARDYVLIDGLAGSLGRDLPFVKKLEERMLRCRNTILLDLGTATKEARRAKNRGQTRVLKYLAIYRILNAEADAIKLFKEK